MRKGIDKLVKKGKIFTGFTSANSPANSTDIMFCMMWYDTTKNRPPVSFRKRYGDKRPYLDSVLLKFDVAHNLPTPELLEPMHEIPETLLYALDQLSEFYIANVEAYKHKLSLDAHLLAWS